MKKKFFTFICSVSAVVIPILFLFELLMRVGYTPLLTNSISFDAKIECIKKNKIDQINLMAIGSSITLNNLSSEVIKKNFNTSYFNFSCWGLQINDIKQVLINYVPKYRPKYVLICSSIPDFTTLGNAESIENFFGTNDYFKSHFEEFFYIRNYNSILDIIKRKNEYDKYKISNDDYTSLNFDKNGGVLLNIPSKNIETERWNEQVRFPTNYTNVQYKELECLCKFLKERGITLIFVQSPIKKSYAHTIKTKQLINAHFKTCKLLIKKCGGIYFNYYDTDFLLDDKLFVDQFHLSAIGATLFTERVADSLKQYNMFN